MAITHGDAIRNEMCNAVVDAIDAGGAGTLKIIGLTDPGYTKYESGNVAAEAAGTTTAAVVVTGAGTGDTIADLTFGATAFKAAGAPNDADEDARIGKAHANEVDEDDNCREGTADWFEIVDGAGTLIMQGSITVQSADTPGDILLTSTGIADGDTIAIRNLSYTCAQ